MLQRDGGEYLIEQFWGHWKNILRNHWQFVRVVEAVQDSDGLVHRVNVHVGELKFQRKQSPSSKLSVIERPIQKVVLLLEH